MKNIEDELTYNFKLEINKRIDRLIKYLHISPYEFSKKLGNKRPDNVYNIINGKVFPSKKTLSKIISSYPEINPEWLITGRGPMLNEMKEVGQGDRQGLENTQTNQLTGMNIQSQKTLSQSDDHPCKEKALMIDGLRNQIQALEARLSDRDRQIEELKVNFEQVVSGRDKQIEDLKNNLGMVIASKDEMLAMKEEAIKGKEATLAAKDEIISIQSKRIAELESHRETEDLKKILGTSGRIGQESISLTDIHPKDLSTKAKKGEYKV